MLTIYKYPIPIEDNFTISLDRNAKVLCVQTQNDKPFIWVMLDDKEPIKVEKEFWLRGTGHDCEEVQPYTGVKYVGTFQMRNGTIVFHLFTK